MEEKKECCDGDGFCCHKGSVPCFGILLIVVGVLFFLENVFEFAFLDWIQWSYVWPVLVILLGLKFVYRRRRK